MLNQRIWPFRPLMLFRQRYDKRGTGWNWFGEYADKLQIVAGGNLPYNMAALVRENMGVFLNLKLNCSYEGMKYIPSILRLPAIRYWRGKESGHVTCGRGALVYFIEEYVKGMDNDEI